MRHQDYLDVSTSVDCETFEKRLIRFAQNMDFAIVTAALGVNQPGEKPVFVVIGNMPEAYLEVSRDKKIGQRDPVMKRLKSWSVPFTYDQSLYVDEDAGDIWEGMAPFGFKTGIAMALHMPFGRHFLLGVDRADPLPQDDIQLTRLLADLQLLAAFAQETAVRVMLPRTDQSTPVPKLTPREREVLNWTREGKSAWAVGQILSMSEHTVNFHLRNAMGKLNVSGKHMAILRAMSLGLI